MYSLDDWWRQYSPFINFTDAAVRLATDAIVSAISGAIGAIWDVLGRLMQYLTLAPFLDTVQIVGAIEEVGKEVATMSAEAEREVRAAGVEVTAQEAALGSSIGHWIVDHLRRVWTWIRDHALALFHDFEALLAAIHFKTIMLIIQIASIVSPAFRAMMKRVYDAISRLSKALGFGPEFLVLALRNSRTLIMDVSSMLGRSYDIGRVAWLGQMSAWLTKANTLFDRYKNHPELVFEDLEEDIEKNFANDGAGAMSGLWGTVAGISGILVDYATDLAKVNTDLYKLLNDLPAAVRENLPEGLLKFMWEGSWYINNRILPDLTKLDGLIDAHAAELLRLRTEAQAAAARILTPVQTIAALGGLSDADKALTVDALDALDNTRRAARSLAFNAAFAPAVAELETLLRLAPPVTPPPVVLMLEPGNVPRYDLGAPLPRQTWFVGEY